MIRCKFCNGVIDEMDVSKWGSATNMRTGAREHFHEACWNNTVNIPEVRGMIMVLNQTYRRAQRER